MTIEETAKKLMAEAEVSIALMAGTGFKGQRSATVVTFKDGRSLTFDEYKPRADAIHAAAWILAQEPRACGIVRKVK